jgi:hypothetical protein
MNMKELIVSIFVIVVPCLIQLALAEILRKSRFWMLGALPLFLFDFAYGLPGALRHVPSLSFDGMYVIVMEIGRCSYAIFVGILIAMNRKRLLPFLLLFLAYWLVWYIYDHALGSFRALPFFTWIISILASLPLAIHTVLNLNTKKLT